MKSIYGVKKGLREEEENCEGFEFVERGKERPYL